MRKERLIFYRHIVTMNGKTQKKIMFNGLKVNFNADDIALLAENIMNRL